ncbi:DUF3445 domain-containing protein [soil metagenome]
MTMLSAPRYHPDVLASLVEGFPFPFGDDVYRYSTNVEPAATPVDTPAGTWGAPVVDIDVEYLPELAERAAILAADPSRAEVMEHMGVAAWDCALTLMTYLAAERPESMTLTRLGEVAGVPRFRWTNRLLGIDGEFGYGDNSSLPTAATVGADLPPEPLRWIAGQVQEDIVLLDQRAGQLWGDAGVVTFAADWSFGFDVGMSFLEIHGPVPRIHSEGVITRAHEFLLRLQPHQPYRRTNWTLTVGRRLDVSTELYPQWGPDRETIQLLDDETFGEVVHLRVEVQHLIRLPDSAAVMFLIRSYMLPLSAVAQIETWRVRAAAVLAELPEDMADYKGIAKYRHRASAWLLDYRSTDYGSTDYGSTD